jgi:preprotein translocase subunit SecY
MLNFITNQKFFKSSRSPIDKVLITIILLFLFRCGNTIPLAGIDEDAITKSFFQFDNNNSILSILRMYSGGGGKTLLSSFSLGIIPYINASIIVDLLTAIVPTLEKLQSEEGEAGRRKLTLYKKLLTFVFAIVQSIFFINYLKPYFYNNDFFSYFLIIMELVSGSLLIVWLTNVIDSKGIGHGTSLIIFSNIITPLINKDILNQIRFDFAFFIEVCFLLFLFGLICISQSARINIEVISARQLAFLENVETESLNLQKKEKNSLSIRFNQAGIFPIIIASNLIPFFSFFFTSLNPQLKFLNNFFYYLLIIGFNYFYTLVFWDPQKISEQLRKASVSIVNLTPGKETVSYLERVVRSSSILGGISLCVILILYDFFKGIFSGYLLNQLNISSLIIAVGVVYDVQKTLRALFKNL